MRSSFDDNHYQKVDNWDSKRADENMPRRIDENMPRRIDEIRELKRIDEIFKNVEKKGND